MTDTIGHVVPQPEAEGSADAPIHSDEFDSALLGASGDTSAADQQDFGAKDAGALAQDHPHRAFAYAPGSNTLAASNSSSPSAAPAPESPFGAFADAAIAAPEIVSGAALLDEAPAIAPSSGSDLVVPSSGSELIPPGIVFQTDPVSNQVDVVVQGQAATNAYGVTGAGIKIGVISDSFNTLGGAAAAEADGALPTAANVHILKDASSGTDEGQAMAEIAHSIAPNAQIYFYTAGSSDAGMAQAIEALQAAGCQIIVDDVAFLDEPYFEEGGTISQAVDQVVADGSTYFTAANNFAQSYYQGSFAPIVSSGTTFEDFNVAGAPHAYYEPITIPRGATVLIDLQWAQPFKTGDGAGNGNGSNYSLAYRLLSASGGTVSTGNALDKGGDPVQFGEFTNTGSSTTFYLEVYENQTGTVSPGEFKIVAEDDSFSPVVFNDPNAATGAGTVFGHEEDPSAITVGAVPENAPSTLEPFSGTGPGEFYYNSSGVALSSPVTAGKVNLLAPDGNSTTIFSPFYGTSAAAPAAAAVGALVLQANGALNPADIENVLDNSAQPTVPGTAAQTGAGLVDAYLAVGDAETLTFSETASTGTLLGTHLNDTFLGGPGSHTINGEAGVNTLSYAAAPAAVTVNFATGTATNGFGGTDSFSNIQIVDGSTHNDTFVSGAAGATIYGGGGLDSLDFSLLAGGGLLALDGGTFDADQGSGSGSNAGTIDATGGTSLEIFGTLANAGSLIANGADLDVTGTLTGAGSALVENGGIFELGGGDAAGVAFGGSDSTLKLDAPTSFAGDAISGLILGDVLDLVGASVASATVAGSMLSIVESGGTNFSYTVSGALAGDHFGITGDGSTGTDLILESGSGTSFALAQATLNTSSTLNLGNARVGGTLSQTLSISNSATPPAESLDVSLGPTSGDATASGAISLLAAGATNTSGITVGLGTASAGAQSGTVTLDNFSDGSGTDGSGTTSLGTGTILVSGNVYREATASASAPSTPLIFHVGGSGAVPITVTNTAASDGFSENLLATVGTTSGVSRQRHHPRHRGARLEQRHHGHRLDRERRHGQRQRHARFRIGRNRDRWVRTHGGRNPDRRHQCHGRQLRRCGIRGSFGRRHVEPKRHELHAEPRHDRRGRGSGHGRARRPQQCHGAGRPLERQLRHLGPERVHARRLRRVLEPRRGPGRYVALGDTVDEHDRQLLRDHHAQFGRLERERIFGRARGRDAHHHRNRRRPQLFAREPDAQHIVNAQSRQCARRRNLVASAQYFQQRHTAGGVARRCAGRHDRRRDRRGVHIAAGCGRHRHEQHRGRARHHDGGRAKRHGDAAIFLRWHGHGRQRHDEPRQRHGLAHRYRLSRGDGVGRGAVSAAHLPRRRQWRGADHRHQHRGQ